MTEKLSSTTAALSAAQSELTTLQRTESELRQQLSTAVSEANRNAQEWAVARQKQDGGWVGGAVHHGDEDTLSIYLSTNWECELMRSQGCCFHGSQFV